MSTNSNFKKDKCWSCEFFCGHRQYKTGILFGDSVETDSQGTCSNNRSNNNGKPIRENDWCSKYQKWGVLQSAITKQEARREQMQQQTQERIRQKQSTIGTRWESESDNSSINYIRDERRQLEEERRRLERERAALEHERWYSSLSPDERERYDAEQARLKAEQLERERQIAEQRAERERLNEIERAEKRKQEEAKKKRNKILLIISVSIVAFIILMAICLPPIIRTIKRANEERLFNESNTGKVVNFIREQSNGDDEYSFSSTIEGIQVYFKIEYLENGFDEPYGAGSYSKGKGKYSFMATTQIGSRDEYSYSSCFGTAIFNWDSLQDLKGLSLIGEVWYGSNSTYIHYQRYTKGEQCPEINFDGEFYSYGTWDNSLNLEEAKKVGWDGCEMTIIFLNQISNEVFGSNLW